MKLESLLQKSAFVKTVAKYSKKAGEKVEEAMQELKEGASKHIQSRKQAIVVGLEKARKAGAKVPDKKK